MDVYTGALARSLGSDFLIGKGHDAKTAAASVIAERGCIE